MSIEFNFKGKVALVTGSSSGIGAATAVQFAKAGADVVVTGLYADNDLSSVANRCRSLGVKVLEMAADVTREADMRALVAKTVDTFGKIDILVNCAGTGKRAAITEPLYMDAFRKLRQTNLDSYVFMTHICVEHLEKSQGTIVNISSIRSTQAGPKDSVYCMSKAATDMFTKCMAVELGPKRIRVNSVNPGAIPTNFMKELGVDVNRLIVGMPKVLPARKCGTPDDIASAVLYLTAPEAAFITGTNLVVDGGHTVAGIPFSYDQK
ncbi:unnamed protein product [Oppiella nova]|uniref:Uncharacterized protein n=1 Tax=Oppiella nova TaxID=334625 RepID=A0A7R9MFL9_9ACAR|nr:unnamed protein product [Oppiella nova]CAG2175504.1 unnamed protein product [Oppiella nova]